MSIDVSPSHKTKNESVGRNLTTILSLISLTFLDRRHLKFLIIKTVNFTLMFFNSTSFTVRTNIPFKSISSEIHFVTKFLAAISAVPMFVLVSGTHIIVLTNIFVVYNEYLFTEV